MSALLREDLMPLLGAVTADSGPDLRALRVTGPRTVLASGFDVTALATGAVAAAGLAAATLHAVRTGAADVPIVHVDSRAASAAFRMEHLFQPVGWTIPALWDPLAGVYETKDGWIRLHTNYPSHKQAVVRVMGTDDRDNVARLVRTWAGEDLEQAVAATGGASAIMRTRENWLSTRAAAAVQDAPAVRTRWRALTGAAPSRVAPQQPFSGVRVLDLTRVIAGPVATRFLASFGADVLRIDPPGFHEVAALLPETTRGKRTAALDLTTSAGRETLRGLLATADVLVCGLRADALTRLGFDRDAIAAVNPDLIVARLNAYGWDGPWRDRRGFDSLVQFSSGIASAEADETGRPGALPAQALDHATGWLVAAAIARALTSRHTMAVTADIDASLNATADLLIGLPAPTSEAVGLEEYRGEGRHTAWGTARGVGPSLSIADVPQTWRYDARPLGHDKAHWA